MAPFLAVFGGIGWGELLIIAFVVLMVFGPKRLPEIAEALGSSVKKFRRATQDAKDEVKREIDVARAETPRSEPPRADAGNGGSAPPKDN
ncbi:MAG: twin-arginine translocase TatA/TatE family subunit [bacterium]|nr:twin-arginine translocase TatA/TatE family subunit [bacterium]